MIQFLFYKTAEKRFKKLPSNVQQKIVLKLKLLKAHPDIKPILKPLNGISPLTCRLRIGKYRLIVRHMSKGKIVVIDVGHRREIYR